MYLSNDKTAGKIANDLNIRLGFMGFDAEFRGKIGSLKDHVEAHLDDVLSQFYEKLLAVPDDGHFFEGKTLLTSAKSLQADHWRGIAAGDLNEDYFKRSNVIGEVHARIGLKTWMAKVGCLVKSTPQKKFTHKVSLWLMRWLKWSRL